MCLNITSGCLYIVTSKLSGNGACIAHFSFLSDICIDFIIILLMKIIGFYIILFSISSLLADAFDWRSKLFDWTHNWGEDNTIWVNIFLLIIGSFLLVISGNSKKTYHFPEEEELKKNDTAGSD